MKAIFWTGLALIIFTLYGYQAVGINLGGGDMYIGVGIALIVLSCQWELITLFAVMAAVFNYQTLSVEYAPETLGFIALAVVSACIDYSKRLIF
jgi:hypothetical protein